MGHIHLATLPATKRWRAVVDLLTAGAATEQVVAASALAAERDLVNAVADPVFVESVRLLLLIPRAARADDFADALRQLDLPVTGSVMLPDIIGATMARLDAMGAESPARSDFTELASRALGTTLATSIGDRLPGLFDATPSDVQVATRGLSGQSGIADLTRSYFGALVSGSLTYWLDRTLPAQVGGSIAGAADRSAFNRDLDQYTRETTRIIREFAPGWYGKTLNDKGTIASDDAARFAAVSMKKIVAELQRKRGGDD